jgi:hypothetical protein
MVRSQPLCSSGTGQPADMGCVAALSSSVWLSIASSHPTSTHFVPLCSKTQCQLCCGRIRLMRNKRNIQVGAAPESACNVDVQLHR